MSKAECGFDLTDFGSAGVWQDICDKLNLVYVGPLFYGIDETRQRFAFKWASNRLEVRTANNPITGEYARPRGRERDVGYASYIGAEGEIDDVAAFYALVTEHATSIKEACWGKSNFI